MLRTLVSQISTPVLYPALWLMFSPLSKTRISPQPIQTFPYPALSQIRNNRLSSRPEKWVLWWLVLKKKVGIWQPLDSVSFVEGRDAMGTWLESAINTRGSVLLIKHRVSSGLIQSEQGGQEARHHILLQARGTSQQITPILPWLVVRTWHNPSDSNGTAYKCPQQSHQVLLDTISHV